MDRQILSQEEINALLFDGESNTATKSTLTTDQKDALGEIGNISYGSASTALSKLFNRRVDIDTPNVILTTQRELMERHPVPCVLVEVDYTEGLSGSNLLILRLKDAAIIADLIMGGSGLEPKTSLGQMDLEALGEVMNQMVGSASTAMATLFDKRIDINPPKVRAVDLSNNETLMQYQGIDEQLVAIAFALKLEGLIESEIMLLIPYQLAVEMADGLLNQATIIAKPVENQVENKVVLPEGVNLETRVDYQVPVSPVVQNIPTMMAQPNYNQVPPNYNQVPPNYNQAPPNYNQAPPNYNQAPPNYNQVPPNYNQAPSNYNQAPPNYNQAPPNYNIPAPPVMVQPAQFGSIGGVKQGKDTGNIGMILDVPLQITVELGRTKMKIKDVLELGVGSIIELDKLAGDPVDIFVNGKLIAKGEVVVIDENFGIKVTDIVSPLERANTLQ